MAESQLVDEFRRLWDAESDPPNLSAFLDAHQAEPQERLEIMLLDQFRRWQIGCPLPVESYFPLLDPDDPEDQLKVQLIDEEIGYHEEHGDSVDYAKFIDALPQISSTARARLGALASASVSTNSNPFEVDSVPTPPRKPHDLIGRYEVIRQLGRGTFGVVYLARDSELKREVAVKVPSQQRLDLAGGADSFLREARVVAALDHRNIVPVYDVGNLESGECYVVSKYVSGGDLHKCVQRKKPTPNEACHLVAVIARALHQAHQKGLVHRDIKPGNILIDKHEQPNIIDFGLALRDEEMDHKSTLVGTPAYMSPEQARGEGHRVDPRSDIYSLGVVLYELLTGKRPHRAESTRELLELVKNVEVRPPRQLDDSIPRELDRICLKALARRRIDRYSTALDLAEELEAYIEESSNSVTPATVVQSRDSTHPNNDDSNGRSNPSSADATTDFSHQGPTKYGSKGSVDDGQAPIIPKGLRSFDADDADFFLELIPGARDRNGLPDSVRFWKQKFEETDASRTFAVGLLYGPSGCGKSSLVKAGIMPRLANHVDAQYIEATASDLEATILLRLESLYPRLNSPNNLVEALGQLRRHIVPNGRKLVLIIDQFEQWLHSWDSKSLTLVKALAQCDGSHVQAIVMVRDDFWMAATRFMRELEIRLIEGENSAAVDLFGIRHSRQVLTAFGRAYRALPSKISETTDAHRTFVRHAVEELAEEGKVVPVRLALFAQMLKNRDWASSTLYELGGASGVGVAFLEESFGPHAPPAHRMHAEAAKTVLNALRPPQGTDIRGQIKSRETLLTASHYRSSQEFDELIRIMDDELRLITPADSTGATDSVLAHHGGSARFYQLTHDFLVPSIHDWMNRGRQTSMAGRAELCLEQRSEMWRQRPEFRTLPSLTEYVTISTLTKRGSWSRAQANMMRAATRSYGILALMATLIVVGVFLMGREFYGGLRATSFRDQLLVAKTPEVPELIAEHEYLRRWFRPLLHQQLKSSDVNRRQQRHLAMALLTDDANQIEFLATEIFDAEPDHLAVLIETVADRRAAVEPTLWETTASKEPLQRLNAAAALSLLGTRDDPRWESIADQITLDLTNQPSTLVAYMEPLEAVGQKLVPSLLRLVKSEQPFRRNAAATALVEYYQPTPREAVDLIEQTSTEQFGVLFPLIQRQAAQAIPILRERFERVRHQPWPKLTRSQLPSDASRKAIIEHDGVVHAAFAFSPWFPVADLEPLVKALKQEGYRLVRLRPFRTKEGLRAAVLWTRDDRPWDWAIGLTAAEAERQTEQHAANDLLTCDAAGYLDEELGEPRYAVVWETPSNAGERRDVYFGLPPKDSDLRQQALSNGGYRPLTRQLFATDDTHEFRHTMVWGFGAGHLDDVYFDVLKRDSFAITTRSYDCPIDIAITNIGGRPTPDYYGGVWLVVDRDFNRESLFGVTPKEHHRKVRSLIDQGYRPASISAAETDSGEQLTASVWQRPKTTPERRFYFAQQQANCAAALTRLGELHHVVRRLEGGCDPALRTELVHVFRSHGCDPTQLLNAINVTRDIKTQRTLVLALGEYSLDEIDESVRKQCLRAVKTFFHSAGDSGLRGAAEWCLRRWKVDETVATTPPADSRNWYVTEQGIPMAVVDLRNATQPFLMGCYRGETGAKWVERAHTKWIRRKFAIGIHEVSVAQFKAFVETDSEAAFTVRASDQPDLAQTRVNWYHAARFCNWLSEQEGIAAEQWCFEITFDEEKGPVYRLAKDYLSRTGYRLPTEAEWEFACRAGTQTARYFGGSRHRMASYAWFVDNSAESVQSVGLLKPNDLGLFDMMGNAAEWIQERWTSELSRNNKEDNFDHEDLLPVVRDEMRITKGGSFEEIAGELRSADRIGFHPYLRLETLGFRVARTLDP